MTRYKGLSLADPSHAERLGVVMGILCTLLGLEGSTKLSYAEFEKKFVNVVGKQMLAGKLDDPFFGSMFDTLDANGDGFINAAEWRAHYDCHGLPVKYAKASFDALDTNHDGLLSRKEFLDYHFEYLFSSEDKLGSSILFGPLD